MHEIVIQVNNEKRIISEISHSSMLSQTFSKPTQESEDLIRAIQEIYCPKCDIDSEIKETLLTGIWKLKRFSPTIS